MGTIDDYLDELGDDPSRTAIAEAYARAEVCAPDAEQGVGYGMPALTYRGKGLLSVMRAKTHIGVYPFSASVVAQLEPLLVGVDHAKGSLRFPLGAPLLSDIIEALVAARVAEIDARAR
jgi:uncharacterized protein YdhG (YjbR/CyaY superfamily)